MQINKFQTFGIVGAGAWGTALAVTLRRAGRDVILWGHKPDVVSAINTHHENALHLKGVKLDPALEATGELAGLADHDAWILAAPAQHTREIARKLASVARGKKQPIIIAAKGIEQHTMALLSDIAAAELPGHPVAVLSGPSFAAEVARGLPTALTLAIEDASVGEALAQAMATAHFRPYLTTDIIGAQLGGAVKNVLAVACGIVTGRRLGENARAALITRGLAEMLRLGAALGARAETLMGLSGLGDLLLTCSSIQSRNMSLGAALGEGKKLADILAARASVAEGVTTAAAAWQLAQKHGVDMPIVAAVDAVLNRNADIDTMITALLARPLKEE